MKHTIRHGIVSRLLRDEHLEKYEHMLLRRKENNEKLKTSMISHLSALNDGVIAIFITVMMLEIPYPKSEGEFGSFMWSVLVFLVSFFIIADFWYDNKRIFETLKEADHLVVVADFLFLASLALIPATTKWVMLQTSRAAQICFGVVYIVAMLMQQFFYFSSLRKRFKNYIGLFFLLIVTQIGLLLIVNAGLMALSVFHPKAAMMLYILLPIISFFTPNRDVK